jgi:hypothetical protein
MHLVYLFDFFVRLKTENVIDNQAEHNCVNEQAVALQAVGRRSFPALASHQW